MTIFDDPDLQKADEAMASCHLYLLLGDYPRARHFAARLLLLTRKLERNQDAHPDS